MVTIKLLNDKLSNIVKNKDCILFEKLLVKIMEDVVVGILRIKEFGK